MAILRAVSLAFLALTASPGWALGWDAGSFNSMVPMSPITSGMYSLTACVNLALKNYPSLRYARAREHRSHAGISLAKTAYLPTFDVLAQELRTTTNVPAGTIFPQVLDVIPIQTGQESNSSRFKSVWANNFGANLSWEVWDFGLRHSNVLLARASRSEMQAGVESTALDVATSAAEDYLSAVAAAETIRARKVTLKRMEDWQLVVHTLVDRGLRPGVDADRADAEVSEARIALISAEEAAELARVDLAEAMGLAGAAVDIKDTPWTRRFAKDKAFEPGTYHIEMHPYAVLKAAAVNTAQSKVGVWDKTWYPHIYFHSAIWGRGSGIQQHPNIAAGGILPQIGNYVAGFSVSFPILDVYSVRAQRRMAENERAAQKANYDLAIQLLTQKDGRARVILDKARRIADETPMLVKAARDNEMKALERYKVGLTNIIEVAESERILANAEVQDAVAQVRVWRGILATSFAHGDLKPFLHLARQAEAESK